MPVTAARAGHEPAGGAAWWQQLVRGHTARGATRLRQKEVRRDAWDTSCSPASHQMIAVEQQAGSWQPGRAEPAAGQTRAQRMQCGFGRGLSQEKTHWKVGPVSQGLLRQASKVATAPRCLHLGNGSEEWHLPGDSLEPVGT